VLKSWISRLRKEVEKMGARAIGKADVLLMSCLIVFWGSSFVVVKEAMREGLTPVAVATFRFLIAGALFLFALLLTGGRRRSGRVLVERKDAPTLLVLALTGVTFFFIIQYTGIEMASASIAAIVVCLLSPILISVLSARIFKERLVNRQVLGIGVAAAGTFIVIASSSTGVQGNRSFLFGSLILLLTPLLWATYTLIGRKIMEKYDPFLVVAHVNMLGGLCLVPFSLAENSFYTVFSMNLHEWLAILYLSVTCSLLGYYIWFYVVKKVGAAVTSTFLFAEPLITAIFAVTFVGENLNLLIVLGGLLILSGVYLVTKKQ
jgi:drug/metabolite transporter (DMT)-like permease